MMFKDRQDAGKRLADKLQAYANQQDVLVLALPRGGVPVAFEVAQKLRVPLDVFIVRKLGLPGFEELAIGAIASEGIIVPNTPLIQQLQISKSVFNDVVQREAKELARRETLYRRGRPPYKAEGKKIILIDDGLATGSSMKAAVLAIKKARPARIIVAVPIGPEETCEEFREEVDECICLVTPKPFIAVGSWYENFSQTTDEEVQSLLDVSAKTWNAA
jgi:predicted phosphoribosyltransferase